MKHNHGEAFALMKYRCKDCDQIEVIWNSRDGVTPFTVDCRGCGGSAFHIDWRGDVYAPDHTPELGSRMFVDLTKDRAMAQAKKNAARYWEEYPPSREQFSNVEALADMLAREYMASGSQGSPDLIVVSG